MSYIFHRVFCATPGDLEPERDAFYAVIGEFNEKEAMKHGILFVSLSIVPHLMNIPAFQGPVDENIRSCRYYIQVLGDTWGPPNRNFEKSFDLARKCAADSASPMREVVLMCKPAPPGAAAEERIIEAQREAAERRLRNLQFSDIESFRRQLYGLLSEWLADVIAGSGRVADGAAPGNGGSL